MRYQEYVVKLSRKERGRLEAIIRKGHSAARQQTRARILLQADTSKQGSAWHDRPIAEAVGLLRRPLLAGAEAVGQRGVGNRSRAPEKIDAAGAADF